MRWLEEEPARGDFPSPGLLRLPGVERVGGGRRRTPPPPIYHLTGLRPVDAGVGYSTFEMPAHPWLRSATGVFIAGTSALVADAPLGGAIISTLPAGAFGVTSELSLSYLRPASIDSGTLRARARVVDVGRSLGLSQATVEDSSGAILAHATSRYYLRHFEIPEDVEIPGEAEIPTFATPDPYERPLPPAVETDAFLRLSGLEYFRALAEGRIAPAPFATLFGLEPADVREGSVSFRTIASEWFLSPARTIYGGVLAFFADAAMTAAATTMLPAGSSCATLDLKVHFLRPGLADGREMTVHGEVVHQGKTLAVTRSEVRNADGKPVVIATGSTMVMHGRPWRPVAVADEPAPGD